ncbi:MAG: fibronectin type III domain-containing protein [Lachnospiraceae bacterium]|nr:fibronectin type III domain-containing protein [Lachnospiraceae bacterium]
MKLSKKAIMLVVFSAVCLLSVKMLSSTYAKADDIVLDKIVFDGDSTYDWSHFYSINGKNSTISDLNITVLDKSGKTVPSDAYTLKIYSTWWDEAEGKDMRQEVSAPYVIKSGPDSEGFSEFVATATSVKDSGYSGSAEGTFHIMDKYCISWICADTVFEGAEKGNWRMCDRFFISPEKIKAPVVTGNDGTVLVEGRDYEITYYTRADLDMDSLDTDRFAVLDGVDKLKGLPKEIGGYVIKLKGTGSYYGDTEILLDIREEPAKIVPAEVSIKKVSAGKKSFTVQWKKLSEDKVTGYQIEYSTNGKFTVSKTVNVKDPDTAKKKVSKLKAKKTYYVRIRSYVTDGSEKIYSDWSDSKKVKIKK